MTGGGEPGSDLAVLPRRRSCEVVMAAAVRHRQAMRTLTGMANPDVRYSDAGVY